MNLLLRLPPWMNRLIVAASVLVVTLGLIVGMSTISSAVSGEKVTFVNSTGETLWIGSTMEDDGSTQITGLPKLAAGEKATITIPDGGSPAFWRGTFFARQRCSGESGSTFHCQVGDCGNLEDRCSTEAQPASLTEFTFDQGDARAPRYDVSYAKAVSLAITIDTPGVTSSTAAGTCVHMDCSGGQLLAACPDAYAKKDSAKGDRINCVNPKPAEETDYVEALQTYGPRAVLWAGSDTVEGNEARFSCPHCGDVVVTFHNDGNLVDDTSGEEGQEGQEGTIDGPFTIKGGGGRCVDVPNAISADGLAMQMHDCDGNVAQSFTWGGDGWLVVMDKCLDVAMAETKNGTKVQLAWCREDNPAQEWVLDGKMLRNPLSDRCLDVKDESTEDGAALQIWDCNPDGQENQSWTLTPITTTNGGEQPAVEQPSDEETSDGGTVTNGVVTGGTVIDQLLAHINAARTSAGLKALTLDENLSKASALHNQLMINGCGLEHQCSGEGDLGTRFSAQGVTFGGVGENIGYGSSGTDDAAILAAANGLTDGMLAEVAPDDGHKKNLLSSSFTRIGLSVIRADDGLTWMTQDFVS
ncbi:ricin-type beta-trefoil lectin domain protein [Actinoplanes sp. NPDC051851]|uniref:ricin-type beta-trefoil lectin domain protein n=1 Tax=Actinoplanes sp. NPDC051851 TaxID=3154753 RepID=UPI00342635BE